MTERAKLVDQSVIDEITALYKEGIVSIEEYRETFKQCTGDTTDLTDDEILEAIAALSDDDDAEFVKNVRLIEIAKMSPKFL